MNEQTFIDFEKYVEVRHKKQGAYNLLNDFNTWVKPYVNLDLIEWQNLVLSQNFSNSYNKRLYYVYNTYLDFLVSKNIIKCNKLREIGSFPVKIEIKKDDYYTYDEFNLFVENIDDIVYKMYFKTLFYTGLRPSEAMALTFNDLKPYYLDINKNLMRKGSRNFDTLKNISSYRKVSITKRLYKELFNLKNIYGYNEHLFIFGGVKPLAPTTIDRIKKRACEKANLRVITQHQFRHSHATNLLSDNVPINVISARLGHSSLDTTCKVYLHKDYSKEKRVLVILNFHQFVYNLLNDFKHLLKLISKS